MHYQAKGDGQVKGSSGTSGSGRPQSLPTEANRSLGGALPTLERGFNAAAYFVDRHVIEGRSDQVALIDDGGSHTYGELAERVSRAGNALKQLGVGAEQRVLLCLLDSIDFPALFYGAIKIGAVPIAVSTRLTTEDYGFMLSDSRARVLAVSAPLLERFGPLVGRNGNLKRVLVNAGAPEAHEKYLGLYQALADANPQLEAAETLADEVAFWLYTSGSTGTPKAVLHRHGSLFYTAVMFAERTLGLRSTDLSFSGPKLWSAFGLGCSLSFPLHVGATAILTAELPTAQLVARIMRKHRPTVFYAVPTLYAKILAEPGLDRSAGFDRLRVCFSSGEMLPSSVLARWKERFGTNVAEAMGSTELLHNFLCDCFESPRPGSVGKPVTGYDIVLLDERGREAGAGEPGDLWVAGPSCSAGYWNNRAATTRVFFGPWARTGDRLMRDADGYFYFLGRADDMLRVGGNWVSPHEVELALAAHPSVAEAAVVGAADADGLVKPKAFVVLQEGINGSPDLASELKAFVKSRLSPFKYPRWIDFCAALPRNAIGKIQRFKLRAPATAGKARPVSESERAKGKARAAKTLEH